MDLIGKQIRIRAIEYGDLEFLRKLINSPTIEFQTVDTHFPVSIHAQKRWYENFDEQKELRCIIENITNKVPIGYISVTRIDQRNQNAVVGIKMDAFSENRTNGDMEEIFRLMKDFCFNELNLHRLEAEVLADNLLSLKNLLAQGFVQEGVLREKSYKHGKWNDIIMMSLLREDYYQE